MRIKVTKNNPLQDELNSCSDISKYIDKKFNVLKATTSGVLIDLNGTATMLYNGEYELVS